VKIISEHQETSSEERGNWVGHKYLRIGEKKGGRIIIMRGNSKDMFRAQ